MKQLNKSLALITLMSSGSAFAYDVCDSAINYPEYYAAYHPECFPGSSTTSTTQINGTSFTQANSIFQSLSSRNRQAAPGPVAAVIGGSGVAAGGPSQAWNAWANHNASASSVRVNNGAGRNDNDIGTTVVGGDYALSTMLTLGVSAAFDRGEGASLAGATTRNTGYTISPYLSYQLTKEIALDASAGFGAGEFSSGAVRADADRWFAGANLSYTRWMDKLQVTGKVSYLHGEEKYEDSRNNGVVVANSGSKNKLDQLRAGVRAGYWLDGVMPYASLTYITDMRRVSTIPLAVDPLGRRAFSVAIGADFFSLSSKVSGGVSYETEQGRTNSRNDVFSANINVRF